LFSSHVPILWPLFSCKVLWLLKET
jgi:hypothetical protein